MASSTFTSSIASFIRVIECVWRRNDDAQAEVVMGMEEADNGGE